MESVGEFCSSCYPNATTLASALFSMTTLASLVSDFYAENRATDKIECQKITENTFDFIIVGAGSAGCVLANRLSAQPEIKVLLMEAGGDPHPLQSVPFLSLAMMNRSDVDWRFKTQPQPGACLGMHHQACYWARGKGLGGTSSLNFMNYARGHPKDYDGWAELTGDDRWAYKNVLKYFLKSEDYYGSYPNEMYHVRGGPLPITTLRYQTTVELANAYATAAEEIGYNRRDFNMPFNGSAFSPFENTITLNGKRASTYETYLKPVLNRKNLYIFRYSHALRVLTEANPDGTLKATGVEYERHGEVKIAYATKEVILSAGSVMSPHILKHSGIGAKEELEKHNITTKLHLPGVGNNMQDHISAPVGPFILDKPITLIPPRDIKLESISEYLKTGTGILSVPLTPATGFLMSSFAMADEKQAGFPDSQLNLFNVGMYPGAAESLENTLNIPKESLNKLFDSTSFQDSFMILVMLSRPKSRGNLTLVDSNPKSYPLIYANYFTDENGDDMKVIVESSKVAMKLVLGSKVFRDMNATIADKNFIGCENIPFGSDAYIECVVRQVPLTIYHYVGTCKMGRRDDATAVVDSELKVLRTTNLRVIDGSIMPLITSGNTNAPIIMIAERGADIILNSY